jgi:inorganic triphosphatase YgiF
MQKETETVDDFPTETETTLVIVSGNSAQVADEVAALTRLDGYDLAARPQEQLHDTYWDRPDGRLGAERIAVRLRRTGHATLITLKGPTRTAPDGAAVRLEFEEPWSPAAFETIRKVLTDAGFWPVTAAVNGLPSDPCKSLRMAGFSVVHDRETLRRPRDLIAEGDPHQTHIAELAIDTTMFHVGAQNVLSREIEVEVKGPGGREAVEHASHALLDLYAGRLKRSNHSKIAMGKAIATIIDKLRSMDGIGPDGSLSPTGHHILDTYLQETDQFLSND